MTIYILWGALTSSIFIYAALTFILQAPEDHQPDELAETLPLILTIVAAAQAPAIIFLRKFTFWDPFKRGEIADNDLAQRFMTTSIVTWAICESVAIYGLVLYMLTYEQPKAIPFFAASFALMLIFAPTNIPEAKK
jgi:hypothetical protein